MPKQEKLIDVNEGKILEIKNKLKELKNREKENIEKVSQNDFDKAYEEFMETEKRGSLYPLFLKLMNQGERLAAYLFILSTWNFAGFRYLMRNFDISKFNESIENLEPLFNQFEEKEFRKINFDEFTEEIVKVYNALSSQVKSVGATKIMHLRVPKVFVLWDRRIREYYGFKDDSVENYIKFLKKMQNKFKDMKLNEENRSFAKAIDEYNYVRITEPIMDLEKELKDFRKKLKERK